MLFNRYTYSYYSIVYCYLRYMNVSQVHIISHIYMIHISHIWYPGEYRCNFLPLLYIAPYAICCCAQTGSPACLFLHQYRTIPTNTALQHPNVWQTQAHLFLPLLPSPPSLSLDCCCPCIFVYILNYLVRCYFCKILLGFQVGLSWT